jgi:hypothetical protein
MKLNLVPIIACIAGMALYHYLGPELMHLRGLIESMVLAELFSRMIVIREKQ